MSLTWAGMEPDVNTEKLVADWTETLYLNGTIDVLGGFPLEKAGDGGMRWDQLYGEAFRQGVQEGIRAERSRLLHGDADCRSCGHTSDCSTHNEPALPTEPCDCKRRTPATSASDRYDEARALLADWDAAAVPNVLGAHNAGGFALHESARIREVLRALAEPAAVNETANDAAMRIWGSRASVDLIIATRGHHPEVISLMERIWHAGLDAGWENWEPENAPGMVDTRATDVLDIVFDRLPDNVGANFIEVEDAHGASVKVGEWVTRPDGHAALRIEVVR